uniref:DDE_Tnp_IS1595 domain-containing protein n=1 Tax=Trichuris muris TaxID=70415 RepID=A0A5S6QAR2_TRIMR
MRHSAKGYTKFQGHRLDCRTVATFICSRSHRIEQKFYCGLREEAAESLLKDPPVIGGPGFTAEVDETVFSRRMFQRGRTYPLQWVFGDVCRETVEYFLVSVGDRDSQTVIPLMRRYIGPNRTVVTDSRGGDHGLSGLLHLFDGESLPPAEVHSQTVESLRAPVNQPNNHWRVTHRSMLNSYLCEFMWRWKLCPHEDPLDKIVESIAAYCPPQ